MNTNSENFPHIPTDDVPYESAPGPIFEIEDTHHTESGEQSLPDIDTRLVLDYGEPSDMPIEIIQQEAEEAAKIHDITDKMENDLEARIEKNKSSGYFKAAKRLFAMTTAGLAIGTAIEAQGNTIRTGPSISTQEELISETGLDLKSIGAKAGFMVNTNVKNGNGEYVIHIDQRHFTPQILENNGENYKKVVVSQKNIEHVVKTLRTAGDIEEIYCEGMVDSAIPTLIVKSHHDITSLLGQPHWEEHLLQNYKQRMEGVKDKDDRIKVIISYLYIQRLEQFAHNQNMSPLDRQNAEYLKNICLKDYHLGPLNDPDIIYACGAQYKLYIDRMTRLLPAETKEGNVAGGVEMNRFQEMLRLYNANPSHSGITQAQLSEEKLRYKKIIMDDRNDIAVQKITSDKHNKIKVVIFGAAHTLTESVEKHNAAHPEYTVGEIEFTPSDFHKTD